MTLVANLVMRAVEIVYMCKESHTSQVGLLILKSAGGPFSFGKEPKTGRWPIFLSFGRRVTITNLVDT